MHGHSCANDRRRYFLTGKECKDCLTGAETLIIGMECGGLVPAAHCSHPITRSNPAPKLSSRMARKELEISIPPFFTCPISLELMKDPVSTCTGVTYDRASIEKWIDDGNDTCPATLQQLHTKDLIPNHTLRRLIQAWCSGIGVERIATPKTPANQHNVKRLFQEIQSGPPRRLEALRRLRTLARDSVRNAICISDEGAAQLLAGLLPAGADEDPDGEEIRAREESLNILALLPLDESAKKKVGGGSQLAGMASLLRGKASLEARISCAEVIERITTDEGILSQACSTRGLTGGLVELLREGSNPRAVKAGVRSLLAVGAVHRNRVEAVEAGAVAAAVDILMETEKGLDESCLCLVELLCRSAEGRAAVIDHALAIPVVVKKMSRSSTLATEHAVSALWSVCGHCQSESVHRYAVECGVCAKLFWLLQVDCSPRAKLKASELIRLLHNTCKDCPCCCTEAAFLNARLVED